MTIIMRQLKPVGRGAQARQQRRQRGQQRCGWADFLSESGGGRRPAVLPGGLRASSIGPLIFVLYQQGAQSRT